MTELEKLQKRYETERDIQNILVCTIEEMSEATKVITKYLRDSEKYTKEKMTEEIAHCLLMLNTVKNLFDIKDEDIEKEKLIALKKCFHMA